MATTDGLGVIHILDVSSEGRGDLSTLLPEGALTFRTGSKETSPEGSRDISTTVAVVSVSLAALRVLAIWITRQTQTQQTEIAIEAKNADGSSRTLVYRTKNSTAYTDASVLKQLAAACNAEVSKTDLEAIEGEK